MCNYGGLHPWLEHHETEYVMSFLIRLNDHFSSIGGQLLLMEPIPPINKVLSLVIQEEKQQEVVVKIAPSNASLVFAVKSDQKQAKKHRSLSTHYGVLGPTIDKCFKLHDYPPGYKPKSKGAMVKGSVNLVAERSMNLAASFDPSAPITQSQH